MKNLAYAVIYIDPNGMRDGYRVMTTHHTEIAAKRQHQSTTAPGLHVAKRDGDRYVRI